MDISCYNSFYSFSYYTKIRYYFKYRRHGKTLQNVAKFPIPHIIELLLEVLSNVILINVGVMLFFYLKKKLKHSLGHYGL